VALANPRVFFDLVRRYPFGGNLGIERHHSSVFMGQVAGINAILEAWADSARSDKADARFVAYALATAYWETCTKMLPVRDDDMYLERLNSTAVGGCHRKRSSHWFRVCRSPR
jgi:hypothetical protein